MTMSVSLPGGGVNLQATLSSATAMSFAPEDLISPHHPITCTSKLYYEEDGTFSCEHSTAPPTDKRTQSILNHSIASLIIELAYAL